MTTRTWFDIGEHPPSHSHPCGLSLSKIKTLFLRERERPQGWEREGGVHQCQTRRAWLWPENTTFLEVTSMVVTWWIVAFLRRVHRSWWSCECTSFWAQPYLVHSSWWWVPRQVCRGHQTCSSGRQTLSWIAAAVCLGQSFHSGVPRLFDS